MEVPKHRRSDGRDATESAEAEGEEAERAKTSAPLRTEVEREAYRQTLERLSGSLDVSDDPFLSVGDVDAYIEDIRGRSSWPGFDVIGPALSGEKRETRAMVLTDSNYEALEAAAISEGRTMQDLLNEAVELWRTELVLNEAEREELKQALAEADEKGTVEFEAFFEELLGDES